ncbi:hypothetical protein PVAP13_9KG388200 [Panicum virgatum]|uniref:Uncharacterized protein n=2 Tax=Panicum virgatum TaxID=38727 RepID=A0A8T0NPD9_PANVG|nr:hypothetical protein PVAP13_9KG388200 [Panicum virgatum]
MMMQRQRRQHGSSGELDVFGATSYFAGLPDYCPPPSGPAADRRLMIQFLAANNNQVTDGTRTMMEDEQLGGLHGDEGHTQLGVAKPSEAAGDEPAKASSSSSSSSSSSRELQVVIDLGVATGDRRLQGVKVVRGGGDGERWVVRCGAWEDAESGGDPAKDDEVDEEGEGGGNKPAAGDWESDSSSDLFDLDLQ